MSARTRVYLPLSAGDLDRLAAGDPLDDTARPAHAVTPALRGRHPEDDVEDQEFRALQEAAAAAPGERVVVGAADLPPDRLAASGGGGPASAVGLTGPVRPGDLVSLHVGDPGQRPTPEQDVELSWYDIGELDEVRDLLSR